jgi:high-affinity iron transporter
LAGTIGFDTTTSWLQLAGWLTYIGLTLRFYLVPAKKVKTPVNA